jgi:hypothetical protein
LVKHADQSQIAETAPTPIVNPQDMDDTSRTTKQHKPKTSEPTREKKPNKAKAKQSSPKPRSTGPKPSQRGYKWPTPDA